MPSIREKLQDLSDAELGELFRSYIADSDHNGWDGYEQNELVGVEALLTDMYIYSESVGPGEDVTSPSKHGRCSICGNRLRADERELNGNRAEDDLLCEDHLELI